jgi:hypothetical protein
VLAEEKEVEQTLKLQMQIHCLKPFIIFISMTAVEMFLFSCRHVSFRHGSVHEKPAAIIHELLIFNLPYVIVFRRVRKTAKRD